MNTSDFYPASQAYDQALKDLSVAVEDGTVTTSQQMKDFLDTRIKQLLEENLKKMMGASYRSQLKGILIGAVMSFLGGMFAISLFNWLETNPKANTVYVIICGVAFFIALIIVILRLRKLKNPTFQ